MADECARLHRSTLATVETVFVRNSLSLSVLTICPTTFDLAIFLSTVKNLSSVENFTMLSFSVHVEDEDDKKC